MSVGALVGIGLILQCTWGNALKRLQDIVGFSGFQIFDVNELKNVVRRIL